MGREDRSFHGHERNYMDDSRNFSRFERHYRDEGYVSRYSHLTRSNVSHGRPSSHHEFMDDKYHSRDDHRDREFSSNNIEKSIKGLCIPEDAKPRNARDDNIIEPKIILRHRDEN